MKKYADGGGIPKTAGKYHAYATEYPEYGGKQFLSTLPKAGRKNRYVPPDAGKESTAGAGRGKINPPAVKRKMSAREEEMLQEVQDAKMRKRISDMGYAKGGSIDGIAKRGKTHCKVV